MEGDLRIGRLKEGIGWADALRLAETIDLNDPGRNGALGRLPDKTGCEPCRQDQRTERHQPPVSRLHARRTDAVVPNLRRFLIGRYGRRRAAIMNGWSLEHHCFPSERSTEAPPPL